MGQHIPPANINMSALNDNVTGTTLYELAKIDSTTGRAVRVSLSDTNNISGIVVGGAGVTGTATICTYGNCPCIFDNTPVIRQYVVPSTSAAGQCHSVSGVPTTGQLLGNVSTEPAASGSSAMVDMTLKQTILTSGGGGGGGTVTYATNTVACTSSPNFNLSTALYSVQQITLSCTVSSMSFSNLSAGARITFRICRDTANRNWISWPGTIHGGMTNLGHLANTCDSQTFYSPDGTNLWSENLGVLNQ